MLLACSMRGRFLGTRGNGIESGGLGGLWGTICGSRTLVAVDISGPTSFKAKFFFMFRTVLHCTVL